MTSEDIEEQKPIIKHRYAKIDAYNPPLPNSIRNHVTKDMDILVANKGADTKFIIRGHAPEVARKIENDVTPLLTNFLSLISQFKEPGMDYKDALNKRTEIIVNTTDELFKSNNENLKELIRDLFKDSVVYSLNGSKYRIDQWIDYYSSPEKMDELPEPIQSLISAILNMFQWDVVGSSNEDLKKYKNPFSADFEIYQTGIWDMNFEKDENNNEDLVVRIRKDQQSGGGFVKLRYGIKDLETPDVNNTLNISKT